MKTFNKTILLCGLLLGSPHVLAQTVTLGTPSPSSAGPGGVVTVPVNFTAGGTAVGGLTIDIIVDPVQFSVVDVSAGCPGNSISAALAICNEPDGAAGGRIRLNFSGDSENAFTSGFMATLTLTVAPGAIPDPTELIDAVIIGAGNVSGSGDIVPLTLITAVDTNLNIQGPVFSSSPAAGGGTEFVFGPVVQNAALASQNLVITNSGIGTLSGTCTETLDAGNVFTVTDGAYSAGAGLNDTVTVACSSAGTITTHTGTMSCTHNGANVASPVVYDLSCQITAGPQPAFSSSNPTANGAINLQVTEAGDPNPTQSLTITNSGAATTTLEGTCAMGMGDSQITLTSAGGFSILQGSAGSIKTVSCDASVQGNFNNILSCTHNGASPASPVSYAIGCIVPEAGSAVFASDPVPGPIDVDGGADVVVDDADPTAGLTFFNNAADPEDQDLDLECNLTGDGAISVAPVISGGILLAPGAASSVIFTCDTAKSGNFTATYACFYQNGGVDQPSGNPPNAIYNLSCEVREPEAQVEITPASGTPQTKSVPPGGSTSFSFAFEEINNEGEDGKLQTCYLESGTPGTQGFTLTSSVEETIGSGSTINVTVGFTDPTGADSWSDTLVCEFSDSDDDDTQVSWPLTVNLGGDARFTVLKDFTDGNPGEVTVDLDCDTGLILDQEKVISEDGIGVTFVVTDFDAGELNCNVTERPVAGYSANYSATGDSASTDSSDSDDGCFYTLVAGGDENTCVISNSPDAVELVIAKEWLYPGSSGATDVSNEFEIVLVCDTAEIVYPNKCPRSMGHTDDDTFCKWLESSGDTAFLVKVIPYEWPGGSCYAYEVNVDQAVEVDNGCSSPMSVSAGSGNSCTITNTVFFEGIPTLNQYGMALMALLMLGMGFVAVRRLI